MTHNNSGSLGRAYAILVALAEDDEPIPVDDQQEKSVNEIDDKDDIPLTRLSLAETIGQIQKYGGILAVNDDKLIISNVAELPDYIRNALRFHKSSLIKYVSAFGGVWPTQPTGMENTL